MTDTRNADEARIARYVKEGRGEGHGASYKPWIRVQDFSSKGRVTRMCCATTSSREQHFLSDLEYALALQCDWDAAVVDMREQYPLPRCDTLAIADELGLRHPRVRGVPVVMTTDLLVDVVTPRGHSLNALSVKYAADLEDAKVLAKLEIERRFWSKRRVRWTLMTEHEIVKGNTETYRRLRQCRHFEGLVAPPVGSWTAIAAAVEAEIPRSRDASLAAMCGRLEEQRGWRAGDALATLWHLAANRRVLFDIGAGLEARGPVSQLSLPCKQSVGAAA